MNQWNAQRKERLSDELSDALKNIKKGEMEKLKKQKSNAWKTSVAFAVLATLAISAGGWWYFTQEPEIVEKLKVETVYQDQPVFWEQLSAEKQNELMAKGMIYFPEVFSKKYRSKYERFSDWLLEQGATAPTIRDIFSGGGRGTIMFDGHAYDSPQIFLRVEGLLPEIYQIIGTVPEADLKKYWGYAPESREERIDQWIDMVAVESEEFLDGTDLPVKQILEAGRVNP